MRIEPLGEYMLVQARDGREPNKENVIILLDGKQIQPYGLVLEIGPDCKTFVKGDRALFMPGNFIGMDEATKTGIVAESSCFGRYLDDLPIAVVEEQPVDNTTL